MRRILAGAICITAVGYHAVGGWDALSRTLADNPHPLLGKEGGPALATTSFLHMFHSGHDTTVIGNVPWYSILLGYPVIGIWYWCCDQTIVQRVLAAKDEKHAMISGAVMGVLCFVADFFKDSISGKTGFLPPDSPLTTAFDWFARGVLADFMLISFGMFCICVVIQICASCLMPEALKEEARLLVWQDWRAPLRGEAHGHGMGNYRVLTVIVLVTFITLYLIFR
ncbi:MAG: hypothetical protein NTV46_00595 [Verrucomicrobia bacterium]|nr:hypothetical protein [Verrucomicrobiota bacterium]